MIFRINSAYAETLELTVASDHKVVNIIGYSSSSDSMVYLTIWDSNGDTVIAEMPRLTDNDEDAGLSLSVIVKRLGYSFSKHVIYIF